VSLLRERAFLARPEDERLVALEEGYSPTVYRCTGGWWTCGVGHVVTWERDATEAQAIEAARELAPYPWSVQDAMLMFGVLAARKRAEIAERLSWSADESDPRRAVLLSMAYQMGMTGLLGFKNTLRAWERGDYVDAARRMRASRWAQQTPSRARRHAEQVRSDRWLFNV